MPRRSSSKDRRSRRIHGRTMPGWRAVIAYVAGVGTVSMGYYICLTIWTGNRNWNGESTQEEIWQRSNRGDTQRKHLYTKDFEELCLKRQRILDELAIANRLLKKRNADVVDRASLDEGMVSEGTPDLYVGGGKDAFVQDSESALLHDFPGCDQFLRTLDAETNPVLGHVVNADGHTSDGILHQISSREGETMGKPQIPSAPGAPQDDTSRDVSSLLSDDRRVAAPGVQGKTQVLDEDLGRGDKGSGAGFSFSRKDLDALFNGIAGITSSKGEDNTVAGKEALLPPDAYTNETGAQIADAKKHFILTLSREEFETTTVDKMMSHYESKTCDKSFGNGLVDAWRQTGTNCCAPREPDHGPESTESSSVRCHLMHQEYHHGNGDNLVHMSNVKVDFSSFADAQVAGDVMRRYRQSQHNKQAYIELPKGAVQGTCNLVPSSWHAALFPGWNADWTTSAFQQVAELDCDTWIDHSVLIVQRDTFANFFHDSEDFVNAFLAMAILRQSLGDTQIYLMDLYPEGPFWPMWGKVFGTARPPMMAWNIGNEYGNQKVCFRDLTIGIYGPASPCTLARLKTQCFHTALVRAYSDFVIRGLGLQGLTRYTSPPSKKVVVTWMARRSSVQWPERKFCSEDGKSSHFTCDYFLHLSTRNLQRVVRNEAEVVHALEQLETHEFANGGRIEFRNLDYNLLGFEDQIKNDLDTDIMIGPHGAGLFHIIFTPDRAALIELQIDNTLERKHFHNLATWSGHAYSSRAGPNPVPVADVTEMVVHAVESMDLSRH